MSRPPDTIPVVVVTGFLGAGKTTLVGRLLADPAFAGTALVVNEFGSVDVDGDLVRRAAGDLLATSAGCLCCTASADIRATLFDLHERARSGLGRPFERVVVETTGLADPAPVINSLTPGVYPAFGLRDHTVARRFRLAGLVTLVDAVTGDLALDRNMEAVRQVAFADRILVTKADLLDDPASRRDLVDLRSRLAAINPMAPVLDRPADLELASLFEAHYAPGRFGGDVEGWLQIDRMIRAAPSTGGGPSIPSQVHRDDVATVVLRHDGPVERAAIDVFLTLLQNAAGAEVLRVKGLVQLADDPDRPAVIHMVRHLVHPLSRLDDWPGPDRRSRLVVIGRGISPDRLQPLFEALVARSRRQAGRSRAGRLPAAGMALLSVLGAAAPGFPSASPPERPSPLEPQP